ncbi:hypothetical protein RFM68_06670 [Mesorhizobium sp. MSK_1335]|uniref:Glycosyl hydrolase family 32 N-terminal domain-containing protein n=1 Tax=Mesorhizobium montanum TaxID=3072323 RepID=A0ABU4ZGL4_9HYPH|nr:hypothetical protein [Mesorhizobium sp. MSK_1335]MDX8524182.1 hypothetical protein [Mesorhizobium sp. MSK_1335]
MRSHATMPIAEHVNGDLFRIYFGSRDASQRSHTGYVVIELSSPERVLDIARWPVLVPGSLGEFDDSGSLASWLTTAGPTRHLYYVGWNLGVTVPFRNAIGLATASLDGSFSRFAAGPLIDRSMREPHFAGSCCVLNEAGLWHMWYTSCVGWTASAKEPIHRYHIKYASSDDGIHWRRDGRVAVDFANEEEYAISRPAVKRDGELWRMWYSYRGDSYRIGYAESDDGLNWVRLDHAAGIARAESGWDSEMIEYPFVFDHEGRRYMLYNGNGYGKTGFGLAVLV